MCDETAWVSEAAVVTHWRRSQNRHIIIWADINLDVRPPIIGHVSWCMEESCLLWRSGALPGVNLFLQKSQPTQITNAVFIRQFLRRLRQKSLTKRFGTNIYSICNPLQSVTQRYEALCNSLLIGHHVWKSALRQIAVTIAAWSRSWCALKRSPRIFSLSWIRWIKDVNPRSSRTLLIMMLGWFFKTLTRGFHDTRGSWY